MKEVYLDYSATTPVKKEVLDEMIPYFTEFYGNPSSLYSISEYTKDALSRARQQVASLINASPDEIYFTGSGTESDNWAIFGVADALKEKGNRASCHHSFCSVFGTKGLRDHLFECTT
jgi:cysteine desulfurase